MKSGHVENIIRKRFLQPQLSCEITARTSYKISTFGPWARLYVGDSVSARIVTHGSAFHVGMEGPEKNMAVPIHVLYGDNSA